MRHAILALVLACLAAAVRGQEEPAEAPAQATEPDGTRWGSGVVARVNREVITSAEVWKSIRTAVVGLPLAKRQAYFDAKLEALILQTVLDQATQRTQMSVSQVALDSFIEDRKEEMGGEEAFQEYLMETGRTEQEYVTDVTRQSQRHLYLRTQAGARGALGPELRAEYTVDPTVAEIRAFYKKNLEAEFTHGAQAKVLAMSLTRSHFRLNQEKLLVKVQEIRQSLLTGADFKTLARRHSRLEEESGGDLGWIDEDSEWAPAIVTYAFEGPVGEISEPLKYRGGYFLALIEDRRDARVVPFSEAQVLIRRALRDRNVARAEVQIRRRLLEESYIWPAEFKERLLRALRPK